MRLTSGLAVAVTVALVVPGSAFLGSTFAHSTAYESSTPTISPHPALAQPSLYPATSSCSPAPCVADTLVLSNGTLVPGNFPASNGLDPSAVAYDNATGEVFVASRSSDSVRVISDATDTVVATVAVGYYPSAVAYDSGMGEIFVANLGSENVSVISDVTDTVVATVGVGLDPIAAAYDSGTGEVFVVNSEVPTEGGGPGTVSVISDVTDTVVATIVVGFLPYSVAYDNGTQEVFVANAGSFTVSVIAVATNSVVATVAVGEGPTAVVYDNGSGEVFVTNLGSHNVSVISDATDSVVATVEVGDGPDAATYDSVTGEVFVANENSDNVSVISDATDSVVATVAVGGAPQGVAYDNGTGEVFVANDGSDTVSVISAGTDIVVDTIGVGYEPDALAFDSGAGEIVVANAGSDNISLISDATDGVVATTVVGSDPDGVAYDSGAGELFVANWGSNNVSVVSDATDSVVATVAVGFAPDSVAYDSRTGQVFVADLEGDAVYVISDATDRVVDTVTVGLEPSAVAYDSGTGDLFVADLGSDQVTVISGATDKVIATVSVGSGPDGVAYDSRTDQIFVTNGASNNVSVISGSTRKVVATVRVGSSPSGVAYDSRTDQIFVSNGASSDVSVISGSTDNVVATVSVGSLAAAVAYDSVMGQVDVANEAQGTLSILSESAPPTYTTTVTERGLPAGTTWHFAINAAGAGTPDYQVAANNTTAKGGSIDYTLGLGNVTLDAQQYYRGVDDTYDNATLSGYSVVSVTGTGLNYPYGNVTGPLAITVTFAENETVSFNAGATKTGYPGLSGGTWSVTLTATTKGADTTPQTETVTNSGLAATASFHLAKGVAYKYTIDSPTFYKSSPSVGSGVALAASSVTIYFALVTGNVVFAESGLERLTEWGVNVTCLGDCGSASFSGTSAIGTLRAPLGSGTYVVQWWNEEDYSLYATTEINVTAPHGQVVRADYDQARVSFVEVGLPRSTEWGVNVTGPVDIATTSTGGTAVLLLEDGTYTVTFWNEADQSLYATTEINVTGRAAQTVHVAYDQARVTFTEAGLSHGTEWGVNVSGPVSFEETSTGASIPLYLEDGTYTVTYWNEADHSLRVSTEVNITARTAVVVHGTYDQARISFTETGLHAGATWGVNVTLSPGVYYNVSTTRASLVVPLSDGTWSIVYWTTSGYHTTNAPPRSVVVVGTASQAIHTSWAT